MLIVILLFQSGTMFSKDISRMFGKYMKYIQDERQIKALSSMPDEHIYVKKMDYLKAR